MWSFGARGPEESPEPDSMMCSCQVAPTYPVNNVSDLLAAWLKMRASCSGMAEEQLLRDGHTQLCPEAVFNYGLWQDHQLNTIEVQVTLVDRKQAGQSFLIFPSELWVQAWTKCMCGKIKQKSPAQPLCIDGVVMNGHWGAYRCQAWTNALAGF